jgi:hypothetical protein
LAHRGRRGGSRAGNEDHDDRDNGERERHREHEAWDDPSEHLKIERRRFAGGLPPTPELYALAREQWYRLPGAVVRPSMDPGVGASAPGPQSPEQSLPDGKGPEQ